MNRATTFAAVAGFILGAVAVLAVQALRRRRQTIHVYRPARREPSRTESAFREATPAPPPEPVPPAGNGDSATPNLDMILAQRALEQRDDQD